MPFERSVSVSFADSSPVKTVLIGSFVDAMSLPRSKGSVARACRVMASGTRRCVSNHEGSSTTETNRVLGDDRSVTYLWMPDELVRWKQLLIYRRSLDDRFSVVGVDFSEGCRSRNVHRDCRPFDPWRSKVRDDCHSSVSILHSPCPRLNYSTFPTGADSDRHPGTSAAGKHPIDDEHTKPRCHK